MQYHASPSVFLSFITQVLVYESRNTGAPDDLLILIHQMLAKLGPKGKLTDFFYNNRIRKKKHGKNITALSIAGKSHL